MGYVQCLRFFLKRLTAVLHQPFCRRFLQPGLNKSKHKTEFQKKSEPMDMSALPRLEFLILLGVLGGSKKSDKSLPPKIKSVSSMDIGHGPNTNLASKVNQPPCPLIDWYLSSLLHYDFFVLNHHLSFSACWCDFLDSRWLDWRDHSCQVPYPS